MQPQYLFPTVKQPTCYPYQKNGKVSSFRSTLLLSKCSDSLGFATKIMQVACLHNECLVFRLTNSIGLILNVEEYKL